MKSRLSLLFVVGLVVAACNGDSSDTTTTSLDAEETTTSSAAETTTTGTDDTTGADITTTTGDGETTTTAGASGGDDCLIGSWVLDDQAFLDQVFASADDGTADLGEVTSVSGAFITTFDSNGSVEAVRDDWGFSVETVDGTFNIVINGTQTGTWATDGSSLQLNLDEGDALDIEASIVVDGEEFAVPSESMDVPSEALASSSEYSCSGDELSVTSEGIISEFDRS